MCEGSQNMWVFSLALQMARSRSNPPARSQVLRGSWKKRPRWGTSVHLWTSAVPLNAIYQVIPRTILENAKGFAIFTVFKFGFLFSARAGSGIVVAKLPDGCTPLHYPGSSSIGRLRRGLSMVCSVCHRGFCPWCRDPGRRRGDRFLDCTQYQICKPLTSIRHPACLS